jgi:hypothetical protein
VAPTAIAIQTRVSNFRLVRPLRAALWASVAWRNPRPIVLGLVRAVGAVDENHSFACIAIYFVHHGEPAEFVVSRFPIAVLAPQHGQSDSPPEGLYAKPLAGGFQAATAARLELPLRDPQIAREFGVADLDESGSSATSADSSATNTHSGRR